MPIIIVNKKTSIKTIEERLDSPIILDVTSKSKDKFVQLSPFYPHGKIPVPFSEGYTSKSVEGIWQGLKVFNDQDVDISKFEIESMKGIKRTVRRYGTPLGHRKGVTGDLLLTYLDARKLIYIPSYEWVLKNKVASLIKELTDLSKNNNIVLLDYTTNDDIFNLKTPLSHAGLIKKNIE